LLYEGFDHSDGSWATKYRVSLGPDQWPAPPRPTWREHLKALGYRLETQEDYDRVYREMSITPEDLDQHLDGYSWEDYRKHCEGPQAQAYQLLKDSTSTAVRKRRAARLEAFCSRTGAVTRQFVILGGSQRGPLGANPLIPPDRARSTDQARPRFAPSRRES